MRNLFNLVGGSLLISGTMIGVGMLAIPVVTGAAGFYPSAVLYIACWVFMLCTGFLVLEVTLCMPKGSNLITLCDRLLFGGFGKALCWFLYLFLFATVMIAHVSSGAVALSGFLWPYLPLSPAAVLYTALCGLAVFFGVKVVEVSNLFFMTGMVISFGFFVYFGIQEIQPALLAYSDWSQVPKALPILFTAFTYQMIIPTLLDFFRRDAASVRICIWWGTTLPVVVYLTWEALILGILPPDVLHLALQRGDTAVIPLKDALHSPIVYKVGNAFSFFTMTASFLALSLSYIDFLADGFHWKKKGVRPLLLCLLVFVPPLLVFFINSRLFIVALNYAGGISCAILFGLLPIIMAWRARYTFRFPQLKEQVPGKKTALLLLLIFILCDLVVEVVEHLPLIF